MLPFPAKAAAAALSTVEGNPDNGLGRPDGKETTAFSWILEGEAPFKVFTSLAKLYAAFSVAVTVWAACIGLITTGKVWAPTFFCTFGVEEGLMAPSGVTKGVGSPYNSDGFRNAEEPSLPEDVGKA